LKYANENTMNYLKTKDDGAKVNSMKSTNSSVLFVVFSFLTEITSGFLRCFFVLKYLEALSSKSQKLIQGWASGAHGIVGEMNFVSFENEL
jgi:hypothetical protein